MNDQGTTEQVDPAEAARLASNAAYQKGEGSLFLQGEAELGSETKDEVVH